MIAVTLLAIFVIPTIRIISHRVGDSTQMVQDPVKRAEFVTISSKLVHENGGLMEVLSCADTNYAINIKSKGNAPSVDPGCDMKISFFDIGKIRKEIPHSIYGYSQFMIEYDGKYYMLIILPA